MMRPVRGDARALCLALVALLLAAGCAQVPPPPLARTVKELLPHDDRDHFVFVWQRLADGERIGEGIQVEHVTAVEGGDFEISLSENAVGVGRVRIRDVADGLVLLSEDDLARGVRLQYEPPLPYLDAPVVPGEQRAASEVRVTTLSDGTPLAAMQVAQVVKVNPAGSVRSLLGSFERAVSVRTSRILHGPSGEMEMRTAMLLVPGVGEIRSDGGVTGEPTLYRELACAIIRGQPLGDCRQLRQRLQEFKRAGPADIP